MSEPESPRNLQAIKSQEPDEISTTEGRAVSTTDHSLQPLWKVEDEKEVSSLTWSGKAVSTSGRKKSNKNQIWDQHYALLIEYGDSHEDFNVPESFVVDVDGRPVQLGNWLMEQRLGMYTGCVSQNHYYQLAQLVESGRLWANEGINSSFPQQSNVMQTRRKSESQMTSKETPPPPPSAVATAAAAPVHVVSPDPHNDQVDAFEKPAETLYQHKYHKRKHHPKFRSNSGVNAEAVEPLRQPTEQEVPQGVSDIVERNFLAFTYSEVEHPTAQDIRIGIGRVNNTAVTERDTAAATEIAPAKGREGGEHAANATTTADGTPLFITVWLDNLMTTYQGTAAGGYLGLRLHDSYIEQPVSELIPVPVDSIVCGDLKFIQVSAASAAEAEDRSHQLYKLTKKSRDQLRRCKTAQEIRECRARVLNEFHF